MIDSLLQTTSNFRVHAAIICVEVLRVWVS